MKYRHLFFILLIVLLALNLSGCGDDNASPDGYANTDTDQVTGGDNDHTGNSDDNGDDNVTVGDGEDSPYVPEGYELVWADEFNTDGLPDETKWVYDTEGNKTGWYNNELQYYAVGSPANSQVSGGKLIITADIADIDDKEALAAVSDYGEQDYISARLITRGKADWTYGFFEIRAKMPCGKGTWPAIWMLGSGDNWPDDGEIDIMEHVGREPAIIYGTIHNHSTPTWGDGGSIEVEDACSNFHNYQLTWTTDSLAIGVDGTVYHTYEKQPDADYTSWPFDNPQYMILNLAIGGDMAGEVDDDIIFPRSMEVDYVRVYQRAAGN